MRNEDRRQKLADAGLSVLARAGSRGLTHRAVDKEAGVPAGTASNYFRSRADLISALTVRIGERLAPKRDVAAKLASRPPNRALYADYLRDIVLRLTTEREATLALFELRLEAARNQEVAATIGQWLRMSFAFDVQFTLDAGLPGGASEIALFHYALDGLLLDRLTTSIDGETSTDVVIDRLVEAILPQDD